MNVRRAPRPGTARTSTRVATSGDCEGPRQRTRGAVLTADLVGFTQLARELSATGTEGSERLHDLLLRCFGTLTDAILDAGGEVAAFAGDALTAVFESADDADDAAAAAWACAHQLQHILATGPRLELVGRPGRVSMRIGVGAGDIVRYQVVIPGHGSWAALGGSAVVAAGQAQASAGPGEVAGLPPVRSPVRPPVRSCDPSHVRAPAPTPAPAPPGAAPTAATALRGEAAGGVGAAVPSASGWAAGPPGENALDDAHRTVSTAFVCFAGDAPGEPRPERLKAIVVSTVAVLAHTGGRLRQLELTAAGVVVVIGFGAPRSSPDDAAAAVACCLELIRSEGSNVWAGVATGDAFCTILGVVGHREEVVIGDCVNLAARLMQSAEPGQLWCDATTAERVRDAAEVHPLGPLPLKGQGEVPVFAVPGLRPAPRVSRGAARATRFVGREAERAELLRALPTRQARSDTGSPRLLVVTGEAGIGKTRLVDAVLDDVISPTGPLVLRGIAGGPGDLRPYLAWRTVVAGLADWLARDRPTPPEEPLPPGASAALLAGPAEAGLAAALGPVLGVDLPDTPASAGLTPPQRAEVLRVLLAGALGRLLRRTPTVIVLDDAQRLDELSEALLRHVLRTLATSRLTIVLIGREATGARAPFPAAQAAEPPARRTLNLGPLPDAETEALVADLLATSGRHSGRGEIARLAARSGGHPLFAEHLVAWSNEQPRSAQGQASQVRLPQDVRRLVMARVDRLVPSDQAGLQAAAVLRSEVTAEAVTECLAAVAGDRIGGTELAHLADVGLLAVVPDVPPPTRYAFRDALVQEVVYEALSSRTKSALHEAAAGRLQRQALAPDADPATARTGDLVEALAFHYGRTARVDKQRQWYDAAALAAERTYATSTALGHLEALARITQDALRAEVLARQGAVLQLTGAWSAAERVLGEARSLAASAGASRIAAQAELELGVVLLATTRHQEAVRCLRRSARRLSAEGDEVGAARALERLTFAQFEHGDLAGATASADRLLRLARACNDDAMIASALEHTGLLDWAGGRFDAAVDAMREAYRLARECGDRRLVVHTANDLAGVLIERGDRAEAVTHCLRALETARLIGYRQAVAYLTGNLGEIYRNHLDLPAARRCHAIGLRAALDLGDWISAVRGVAALAILAADAGQPGHRALLARAIAVAGRLHHSYTLIELLARDAEAALDDGDPDAARRSVGRAATIEGLAGPAALRLAMIRARADVEVGLVSAAQAAAGIRSRLAETDEPAERVPLLTTLALLNPADREAYDAALTACAEWHASAPTWTAAFNYRLLAGGYDALPTPPLPADLLAKLPDELPDDVLVGVPVDAAGWPEPDARPPDPAGPDAVEALVAAAERLASEVPR